MNEARAGVIRVPLIVLAAVVINVLLFTAIETMVGLRQIRLTDATDIRIANFIRMSEPTREVRSRREPKAPQKPAREMQQNMQKLSPQPAALAGLSVSVPELEVDLEFSGAIQIARELTPLVRIPPEYPAKALIKGIEGYVMVRFTVTETGSVVDPEVLRSDPPVIFDRAAIQAVKRWKFQPQFRNGKPVRVSTFTRIRFEMMQEGEQQ